MGHAAAGDAAWALELLAPLPVTAPATAGVGAMMVAADGLPDFVTLAATVAGGYLAAGGAHSKKVSVVNTH